MDVLVLVCVLAIVVVGKSSKYYVVICVGH